MARIRLDHDHGDGVDRANKQHLYYGFDYQNRREVVQEKYSNSGQARQHQQGYDHGWPGDGFQDEPDDQKRWQHRSGPSFRLLVQILQIDVVVEVHRAVGHQREEGVVFQDAVDEVVCCQVCVHEAENDVCSFGENKYCSRVVS